MCARCDKPHVSFVLFSFISSILLLFLIPDFIFNIRLTFEMAHEAKDCILIFICIYICVTKTAERAEHDLILFIQEGRCSVQIARARSSSAPVQKGPESRFSLCKPEGQVPGWERFSFVIPINFKSCVRIIT